MVAANSGKTIRPPRTLIVTWHWPPTNRASARVLGALFASAPEGVFRVITRSFDDPKENDRRSTVRNLDARVPPSYVRWPFDDSRPMSIRMLPALLGVMFHMVACARRVDREWGVERVLAVYPHRFSLITGWWMARKLRVPLVLYMHDLCAEAMTFMNPFRRWFWRMVDRVALAKAWLVLVPTEEFAAHYRQRGIHRSWVLPHCVPELRPHAGAWDSDHSLRPSRDPSPDRQRRVMASAKRANGSGRRAPEPLHLLYSGQVYDPHADAARAFIDATCGLHEIRTTFHSKLEKRNGFMRKVGARWLPLPEAMAALENADACVVLLGSNTPCPEEVMGCFPSKLIDYLMVGRPVLAVVPKGCFVDRLVSQTRCGVTVHGLDAGSIRSGIERLRFSRRRREMAQAGRQLMGELAADVWMGRLLERLRLGPGCRSSLPPFPLHNGNRSKGTLDDA